MRNYIITASIALLLGFGIARYTTPKEIITQTKTVTIEKEVESRETKQDHTKTKIVEVVSPDGTKSTTTDIDEVGNETKNTTEISKTKEDDESSHSVFGGNNRNFSLLVGMSPSFSLPYLTSPVFGATYSVNVLGPITAGAWGLVSPTLSTKIIGISLGINY